MKPRTLLRIVIATATIALMMTLATSAFAAGQRLTVELQQPFELNGTMYDGGQISVKVLREHTPSIVLNEVWVGNERVGMLMAHRQSGAVAPASEDSIVFRRTEAGHLELVGYSLRGEAAADLYAYGESSKTLRAQWQAPEEREKAVLVASR